MALIPKDLGASTTPFAQSLRFDVRHNKAVKFNTDGAGGTLPVGTPLVLNAGGGYDKWTQVAGLPIRAFIHPLPVTLDAVGEVLGVVMLAGDLHRDDVPLGGETQGNMDTALKADTLRIRDLLVQGLEDVDV